MALVGNASVWTANIVNGANETVENFYWPYLGDVEPPADTSGVFQMTTAGYADPQVSKLWPVFPATPSPLCALQVFQLFPAFGNTRGFAGRKR